MPDSIPTHIPHPGTIQGHEFLALETPVPEMCDHCGAVIENPAGCRVVVYLDIYGKPMKGGLLCPAC